MKVFETFFGVWRGTPKKATESKPFWEPLGTHFGAKKGQVGAKIGQLGPKMANLTIFLYLEGDS